MKIAYLGPAGTFTETAASQMFQEAELVPILPIRRVVQAVETGKADYGVVPLENIYETQVKQTLDALRKSNQTRIIREASFRIVHCMGALPNHEEINMILSKDQALDQCDDYLFQHYPNADTIPVDSTGTAATRVYNEKLFNAAAIAPESSLIKSGLEILAENICPNNRTRFAALGREYTKPTGNDKTFLTFHPLDRDKPRVLLTALGFFGNLDINLDFITSRAEGDKGYHFYIELTGHEQDETVQHALKGLRLFLDREGKHPEAVKILGSYPNTDWKNGI